MNSKLYSLRARKSASSLIKNRKSNVQTKLTMNNYVVSGRRVLRSYSKFCSTSFTLKPKKNLENVKSKAKAKPVKEIPKSKPQVKKCIKRVASFGSRKKYIRVDSRSPNKSAGCGIKSKTKLATVGRNLKLARKKCMAKNKKMPSNQVAINFSPGNAAVPSTSKQSLVKRSVKSKTKTKPVAKKAQNKKCQGKRKIKKVVPVRSGKRNFKRHVKKLVKGSSITNTDAKKGKNKKCQTLQPSTSSKISQTSPISTNEDAGKELQNCSVCLNEYKFPVKLPCSHIFCFLCAKGFILRNARCALCREIVQHTFLHNPVMVNKVVLEETNDYKWFYEGSCDSWWQYDDESNDIIEEAFQNGSEKCDVMIAGFMYEINIKEQCQHKKFGFSTHRRIKRAKDTIKKKGIAGVPIQPPRKKRCLMVSRLQ